MISFKASIKEIIFFLARLSGERQYRISILCQFFPFLKSFYRIIEVKIEQYIRLVGTGSTL